MRCSFGAKERSEVIAEVRAESRPAVVSVDRETKRNADAAKAKAAAAKKKQEAAEDARVKAEQKAKDEDEKDRATQVGREYSVGERAFFIVGWSAAVLKAFWASATVTKV